MPEGFARAYARSLPEDALKAYDLEPRSAETTTTTLKDWAGSILRPAVEAFPKRG